MSFIDKAITQYIYKNLVYNSFNENWWHLQANYANLPPNKLLHNAKATKSHNAM